MKVLFGILGLFFALVTLPIGLWLQYQVLARVGATELMWFLYWCNLPVIIATTAISKLLDRE